MARAIPVELKKTENGWTLLRDGQPYFIRGAGGSQSLEKLVAAGGNSIRTWGSDDIQDLLDEAHALGLTVTVGIWLGHERHGFDYSDKKQVEEQKERARQTVLRYRDHPAVLLWGLGNEMEGFSDGDNPLIWAAVNDIAAMVKKLDPVHPTMSVTAEIGGERIKNLHQNCPAVDIHGINAYGGAPSLLQRLRANNISKPFILTEFGPPGGWETEKNEWGAPIELTSTEKAQFYKRAYQSSIIDSNGQSNGLALGSYVFIWGYKVEATATWFGMFLPNGAKLGVVDTMTELWSGKPAENLSPLIEPLVVEGSTSVKPNTKLKVRANVKDPEGSELKSRWVLLRESNDYNTGGDHRPMPTKIEDTLIESNIDGAIVRMPQDPGAYRLYLYAYDAEGNAAMANTPLHVKGESTTPLPFYVYENSFEHMPWAPSGWMGATENLVIDGEYNDNPYKGESCIKLDFRNDSGSWVGVAWQHPANDWGDKEGGFDLSNANYLEFWARGESGGEIINVGVGLLGSDKAFPDSDKVSVDGIELGKEWQRHRIPLQGRDLSSIKTGFIVSLSDRHDLITVYLDDIRFVR